MKHMWNFSLFIVCMLILANLVQAELILCVGDSITWGSNGARRINGYPFYLSEKIDGWQVINAARSSETTEGVIELLPALVLNNASYVLIDIGSNDIHYGRSSEYIQGNLLNITNTIKSAGSKPVLATYIPRNKFNKTQKQQLLDMNQYIRELAMREGYALIDFYPLLEDPEKPGYIKANMSNDGVHPNELGYRIMADGINLSIFQKNEPKKEDHPDFLILPVAAIFIGCVFIFLFLKYKR